MLYRLFSGFVAACYRINSDKCQGQTFKLNQLSRHRYRAIWSLSIEKRSKQDSKALTYSPLAGSKFIVTVSMARWNNAAQKRIILNPRETFAEHMFTF